MKGSLERGIWENEGEGEYGREGMRRRGMRVSARDSGETGYEGMRR